MPTFGQWLSYVILVTYYLFLILTNIYISVNKHGSASKICGRRFLDVRTSDGTIGTAVPTLLHGPTPELDLAFSTNFSPKTSITFFKQFAPPMDHM